jgi:hypothetical protein
MQTNRANELTTKHTAFKNFSRMLNAAGGYSPTLRPDIDPELAELADLYDAAQSDRNDPRRAYRG